MQPPVATAGECDGRDSPQLLQKAMREAKCFQQKVARFPKLVQLWSTQSNSEGKVIQT